MGSALSGQQPHADWPYFKALYEADYEPQGITITAFAHHFGLEPKHTSNAFLRVAKKAAMNTFHDRNKPLLLKAQEQVRESLEIDGEEFKDGKAKKAEFALKVFEKVAQREEPNPEIAQAITIVTPPLFAESSKAMEMIKALQMEEVPRETIEEKKDEAEEE